MRCGRRDLWQKDLQDSRSLQSACFHLHPIHNRRTTNAATITARPHFLPIPTAPPRCHCYPHLGPSHAQATGLCGCFPRDSRTYASRLSSTRSPCNLTGVAVARTGGERCGCRRRLMACSTRWSVPWIWTGRGNRAVGRGLNRVCESKRPRSVVASVRRDPQLLRSDELRGYLMS